MTILEAQSDGGFSGKKACDFCNEEPENGALVEKPNSMIIHGQVINSHRPAPLFICIECLTDEVENI